MRVEWRHNLSVKLITVISGILLANLALYTYFTISRLESDLTQAYSQNAYSLSNVIKKSTRYSMLLNRSEDIYRIIKTIGEEKGVVRIRIYDKAGMIVFSTDSTEMRRSPDKTSGAGMEYYMQSAASPRIPFQDSIRISTDSNGKKVMGLINPIQNEKDCSNSSCHAHEKDREILGVLDVVISMDNAERIIRSNTKNFIFSSVAVTVVISVFSGFFITVMLSRPIMKINKGIQEIGKGNLNYKISLNSNDELGHMAHRFNDMSAKLDTAYKEIQGWSDSLNRKVNEKTEELKNIYLQVIQIEKLASLGKLSATVAHELNNPLEGILTYSKLIAKQLRKIQENGEFEKPLGYLALISDESSRCGKIVKDLLIFSHRDEEVFIQEDLHELIRKGLALVEHHLRINNITVEEDYSASPSVLACNPHKIRQALLALFMNAIEAIGSNGKLKVMTVCENKNIIMRIKDTGSGIREKDLPHIFEPFYTTKTGGKGTGLGLSVVYGIINQHQGSVNVEETSPQGTVFRITLPLPVKTEL
jgi:two-component system, NtrC family, sensor kinase